MGNPIDVREEGIYEEERPRSWGRHLQTQMNQACGNSGALVWKLWSLHGTKLGPLYVGDKGEAWTICAPWSSILELISYGGRQCSALMQGWGRACSYLNLIWQTLLISHGGPYLLGGVDGGWAGGKQESRGRGKAGVDRGNCRWNIKWN